jgi:hypothetical protein
VFSGVTWCEGSDEERGCTVCQIRTKRGWADLPVIYMYETHTAIRQYPFSWHHGVFADIYVHLMWPICSLDTVKGPPALTLP